VDGTPWAEHHPQGAEAWLSDAKLNDGELAAEDADPTDVQRADAEAATNVLDGTEDTRDGTDVAQAETLAQAEPGSESRSRDMDRAGDDVETQALGLGTRRRAGEAAVRKGASIAGRYQVRAEIARGSMARVYEAEQVSVGRKVALKVINREFAKDSQALARFRREAAVLAKIDHPNIVTVHDIGTTATGEPYLVMEYVSGRSLSDIIREQGRIPLEQAVSLLLQISRALHTVHEEGVVHRDLKPGNILVTTKPSGVQVAKIADFGLAKVVEERRSGEFMTRAGTILGTPEYMSPEQIKGGEVDRRADVYSLGCMAYEMLTGAPPFVGEEEMSTLYRHLHEQPPPLRKACPEANIPRPFQPLMDKTLAKERDERIPSAFDFYVALLEAADDSEIKRSKLRIVESLYEDASYAKTHDSGFFKLPDGGVAAADKKKQGRTKRPVERILVTSTLVILALALGILIERSLGSGSAPESASKATPASKPAVGPELLIYNSRPRGASVSVDGAALAEPAPGSLRGIAPGEHTLVFSREGFADVERTVRVAPGARVAIDVTLPPESRPLEVATIPAGAVVYVDGRPAAASTPATISLVGGEFHEIRLEKSGYEPLIAKVSPDDREPRMEVPLEAEKRPIGTVWVDSNAAASVWLDGIDTGFVAPTVGLRVDSGRRHTIELRDAEGRRMGKAHRFEVARGETIHLTLNVE